MKQQGRMNTPSREETVPGPNTLENTSAVRRYYVDRSIQTSLAGREFDPAADLWVLSKEVTLNLGLALCHLAEPLRGPYRAVMAYLAGNYSVGHCMDLQKSLTTFLCQTGTDAFTVTALLNYRSQLDRSSEYKLGRVRILLRLWHKLGYPDVPTEVIDLLDSWTLKGNEKGASVKSLDPRVGPLDDIELLEFNETAAQMFEKGEITKATLAFALLLSHTGRRPGQLALIRIGHLFCGEAPDLERVHLVQIPRAKLRGKPPGSEMKAFAVTADLYRLLKAQADSVVKNLSSQLNPLPKDLIEKMPLFPNWDRVRKIPGADTLALQLENDLLYASSKSLSAKVSRIPVFSHRLGEFISISPRRFRYTIGTRAAREGFGEYVIAELLDHSDTQNAKVYTRQHPNFGRIVDAAVGQQLIPLAQAYAGTLVDRETDALNGSDLSKRVRNADGNIGTCGSQSFCGANPVACYTCIHFQPWLHAKHEVVLNRLEAERRRIFEITGDEAVTSACDRSILGVMQVIALCKKRKAELEEENNG